SLGTIDFGFMSPDFTYVNSSFAERTISFNNIKVAPPGFNPTSPEYDPRQLQNCGSAQFRVIRMPSCSFSAISGSGFAGQSVNTSIRINKNTATPSGLADSAIDAFTLVVKDPQGNVVNSYNMTPQ